MRSIRALPIILSALALAACGGGGGGGGSSLTVPGFDPTLETAYTIDVDRALAQAMSVADSIPRFGSVTQSTNRGASGVTSDSASVSHDGTDLTVTITRQDSSTLTFHSGTDTIPGYSSTGVSPVPGHQYRDGYMLTYTGNSLSAAYALVSWNSPDPTDYLAGGYWMHITGDLGDQRISGFEVGAFADGPELDGAPALPAMGTATYTGPAGGLYTSRHGSGTEIPPGTIELGQYAAPATLSVDFAGNTISGCIGCGGLVDVEGIATMPDGESREFSSSVAARLEMGPTRIHSDGTFTGSDLTFTQEGATTAGTSGYWGGGFSTIQDAGGNPRLVAGTNSASVRMTNGSEGALVGAFLGVGQ